MKWSHRTVRRAAKLSAALTILTLTGCVIDEPELQRPQMIVPLAVGNTWDYTDSIYEGDAPVRLDSLRVSIAGSRRVNIGGVNQKVFLWNVHEQTGNTPSPLSVWMQNRQSGNYTMGAQQDTASFSFETLHLKYPSLAGERYPIHFLSFTTTGADSSLRYIPVIDTLEALVVNPSDTCITPAGTFPCVHYRGLRPGGIIHADSWYAPGIGWLGSETFRDVFDGTEIVMVRVRRVLRSYSLH
jgi:hypothetical protein